MEEKLKTYETWLSTVRGRAIHSHFSVYFPIAHAQTDTTELNRARPKKLRFPSDFSTEGMSPLSSIVQRQLRAKYSTHMYICIHTYTYTINSIGIQYVCI